jgi:hypothetical protein
VAEVIAEALTEPLEPLEDTPVPSTLITSEDLARKAEVWYPEWVPLEGKAAAEEGSGSGNGNGKNNMGVAQRRLSNGMRVNMISMGDEPQRASVRLYVPGA